MKAFLYNPFLFFSVLFSPVIGEHSFHYYSKFVTVFDLSLVLYRCNQQCFWFLMWFWELVICNLWEKKYWKWEHYYCAWMKRRNIKLWGVCISVLPDSVTAHLINQPFKNIKHFFHPLPAASIYKINFSEDFHLACLQHLDLAFNL